MAKPKKVYVATYTGRHWNTREEAIRDYKNNPNNYNPGQPNYQQLVNKRANEVCRSPEIQNWYKTYLKRSLEEGGK